MLARGASSWPRQKPYLPAGLEAACCQLLITAAFKRKASVLVMCGQETCSLAGVRIAKCQGCYSWEQHPKTQPAVQAATAVCPGPAQLERVGVSPWPGRARALTVLP